MKIVIVDDGVSPLAVNCSVINYEIQNQNVIKKESVDYSPLSHGSLCAKIINKYADVDEFISIKVLSEDDQGLIEDLIEALRFCVGLNIHIINISCGVAYNEQIKELYAICSQLYYSKTIIISAMNNNGDLSYPACFTNVISVEQESIQTNYHKWYRVSNIVTNGEHLLKQENKNFYSMKCNSYACAYACAIIANNYKTVVSNGLLGIANLQKDIYLLSYNPIYDFSLLSNPIIISQNKSLKKQIQFEYKEYPCSVKPHSSIIVIPDQLITNKYIINCLSQCKKLIDIVIWCGKKIPHAIKKWCDDNNVYYWDESVGFSDAYFPSTEEPILYLYGDTSNVIPAMYHLNDYFIADGYNSLMCSNISQSYLFGFKHIYNKKSIDIYSRFYSPDIILVANNKKLKSKSDIIIMCDSEFTIYNEDIVIKEQTINNVYRSIHRLVGS